MRIELLYFKDGSIHYSKSDGNDDVTLNELLEELQSFISEIGIKEVREKYGIRISF